MADTQLPPGTLFAGDFRILRALGRGGMGAVYVAHQISTARDRALKLMHPLMVADADLRRRFEQEATVGSRIRSEHVVEVVAAGVDSATGMPWLAMELLEGEDLACAGRRTGPLAYARCLELVTQICHALAAAHAAGIVHRDLKPENVFLAQTHREGAGLTVKLLDFGIAKIVAGDAGRTASMGTPLWMAPEQGGGVVGPPADVWALGLMVFWMLTGRFYWLAASGDEAPSAIAILQEVVTEPLQPAGARARRLGFAGPLPDGFDEWFARCLVRDPAARFPDAGAARAAFARLVAPAAGAHRADWSAPTELPAAGAPGMPSSVPPAVALTSTARGAAPRMRLWLTLGIAVAVGVTLVIGLNARRDKTNLIAAPPAPAQDSAPATPLAVPQGDRDPVDAEMIWDLPIGASPSRGAAEALVTIIEFGNFQCPFSKRIEEALRQLLKEHPNDIRLIWKDNPLAIHSLADGAAQLARELGARKGNDAFWQAHDALMHEDFSPEPKALIDLGVKLGLERGSVDAAIRGRAHGALIDDDLQLADDYAVAGTPAFFVNGKALGAGLSPEELRSAVLKELEKARALMVSGVARGDVYRNLTADGHRGLPLDLRKYSFPPKALYWGQGPETAKVVLVQFCSFEDFLCQLIGPSLEDLLKKFNPDLGLIWLDYPDLQDLQSSRAAILARLAFQQGGKDRFVAMSRRLFAAQDEDNGFANPALLKYAKEAGLDRGLVEAAFRDPVAHASLAANVASARTAGIKEVPGFLVCRVSDFCRDGGYYLGGAQAVRAFEKRIRLVLAAGDGPLPVDAR